METRDKHYHLLTQPGRGAEDTVLQTRAPLPAELEVGRPVRLDFTISDDLPRWGFGGTGPSGAAEDPGEADDRVGPLAVSVERAELPEDSLRKINHMYKMHAPRQRISGYWFVYTLERGHWPKKGANRMEITLLERDPEVTKPIRIRDLELETRYLMGKNFTGIRGPGPGALRVLHRIGAPPPAMGGAYKPPLPWERRLSSRR